MSQKINDEIRSVIERSLLSHLRAMVAVVLNDNEASVECKETVEDLLRSGEEFVATQKREFISDIHNA